MGCLAHGRIPLKPFGLPRRMNARSQLEARRKNEAYVAVQVLRPSLDERPKVEGEVGRSEEGRWEVRGVRRAREQTEQQRWLAILTDGTELFAPAVPMLLVVDQMAQLVAVRALLPKGFASEDERPQVLRIVVVVEGKAVGRGRVLGRLPAELGDLLAPCMAPYAGEYARRAVPQVDCGVNAAFAETK